ncbi:MAG: hypothetical protein EOM62_14710 [Bacteroidia bacterium]|nr:hypothetical protein [Bacteroidia bacterium]
MRIQQSKIRNPQLYLYELSPGDSFYIATPIAPEDSTRLQLYGFQVEGQPRVPIPRRNATTLNADGRWMLRKDLPKEPRSFEHEYHIVDWHGNDHYGTCWQTRKCYQRELIPPAELCFTLDNGTLYSPLFQLSGEIMESVKLAINVMLEILGRCEIWTSEKVPVAPPIKQREVPWEILRKGTRDREAWEEYVTRITEERPQTQRNIIKQRHEHLWEQTPDFCVLGTQSFWGYVVYGFSDRNLFVFECNQPNNATYVFRGSWEAASQLTKTEILAGHLHEARLFHTEQWRENVRKLIINHSHEVA